MKLLYTIAALILLASPAWADLQLPDGVIASEDPVPYPDGTGYGPYLAESGQDVLLFDENMNALTLQRARCYLVFVDDRGPSFNDKGEEGSSPWFLLYVNETKWRFKVRGHPKNRGEARSFVPN